MQPEALQSPAPSLREYLAILRYRKWTVLLTTLLVVGAALFFSVRQTPMYESETRVLVRPRALAPDIAATPVNLETERALIDSAAVASRVRQESGIQRSIDSLLDDLETEVETDTEILSIRFADPDPVQAQELSQAFAESYIAFRVRQAQEVFRSQSEPIQDEIGRIEGEIAGVREDLEGTEDPEDQAILSAQLSSLEAQRGVLLQEMQALRTAFAAQGSGGEIVQPSTLPDSPATPDHVRNLGLAIAVGLILGIGFAFLRERLDERLASREELEEQIGAPVLATIPRARGRAAGRRLLRKQSVDADPVSMAAPTSASAEAYRTLRTNVQFQARAGDIRVIGVVSPAAGEGKTTTAANLAVALGRAGRRVIVVSGDLRKPKIHRTFGVHLEPGITNVLAGAPVSDAFQRSRISNVLLLASGKPPNDPAELIESPALEMLIGALRELADFVIVDTPPLLAVSDGASLAGRCDGVLVVADARTTERGALALAREQLDQVGARVLGGVLNNFDASRARYSSHYHGRYYAAYRTKGDTAARPADDPRDWDPAQMWNG